MARSDAPLQSHSEQAERVRTRGDNLTAVTITAIKFFSTLVDRFGWPGAALIAIGVFTHLWSTAEQKQQIVDQYILGNGMYSWWPLAVPSTLFVLLIWAQYVTNRRIIKKLKREMRRIGEQKSQLQEKLSNRQLRHGKPDDEVD